MRTIGHHCGHSAILLAQADEPAMLRCKLRNRLRDPAGQQNGGGGAQTYKTNGEQRERNKFHL